MKLEHAFTYFLIMYTLLKFFEAIVEVILYIN